MFDLEDTEGIMRTICWPEQFAQYESLVQADAIVVIRGSIDKRPGSTEANFIVNEVIRLEDLAARYTRGVLIRVQEEPPRPAKARTAPRNPPRLPRHHRTATPPLPRRRPPRDLQMLRSLRRHQPRNAHPRR